LELPHPPEAWPVDEVSPEDHSYVVEFEALGCVDATNLIYSPGIGRPEVRFGNLGGGLSIGFCVPRGGECTDSDVVHECAVLERIRPRPAEPGHQPRGVTFCRSLSNQCIQLFG